MDTARLFRDTVANARIEFGAPALLDTIFVVSLGDRAIGHYRKEEKAVVTAHQIRMSDVYAGLTWQKTTHAHSGRQVWTCDVHGATITLQIEPRKVE